MLKKNMIITALLMLAVILLGQSFQQSVLDYGLMDMRTIGEMEEMSFAFESVLDAESAQGFAEYHQEYVEEALVEEFIAVVRPTEKIVQRGLKMKQEVQILDVLKGDQELIGQTIMLQGGSVINHYIATSLDENEEEYPVYTDNNLYFDAVSNIMYPEHTYVVFFNNAPADNIYIPDLFEMAGLFAYFKLDSKVNLNTVTEMKKYTLKDLKGYEFFSSSNKTLQQIYKIKNDILKRLNLK